MVGTLARQRLGHDAGRVKVERRLDHPTWPAELLVRRLGERPGDPRLGARAHQDDQPGAQPIQPCQQRRHLAHGSARSVQLGEFAGRWMPPKPGVQHQVAGLQNTCCGRQARGVQVVDAEPSQCEPEGCRHFRCAHHDHAGDRSRDRLLHGSPVRFMDVVGKNRNLPVDPTDLEVLCVDNHCTSGIGERDIEGERAWVRVPGT